MKYHLHRKSYRDVKAFGAVDELEVDISQQVAQRYLEGYATMCIEGNGFPIDIVVRKIE